MIQQKLIFDSSDIRLLLTDCLTIYVAKSIFAGFLPAKTIFATSVFPRKKGFFHQLAKICQP